MVPGSTIATPFIISLADKAGIRLNSKIPEKYKKKEKEGNAKKLELEKKEYLRLKKKFEKT